MKKIFNHLQVGLLGVAALFASSCKNEKLAESVTAQNFSTVNVSIPARTDVVAGSTYTLTAADVTVPATLTLSSAASSTFTVNLITNVDTVAQLVTAGTLPAGTVAFSQGALAVAPQITFPAGVTTAAFSIIVNRSFMEQNFGKTLAAVVKLSAPTRGNKLGTAKTMIVTVKTGDILDPASIHQLAFAGPRILNVASNPAVYTVGSLSITVAIPIALQGTAGPSFTVKAVSSPDSVTKYINNGTLPNSVLYSDNNISIANPTVTFLDNASTATLTFSTKVNTLLAVQPAAGVPSNKFPTVAFTISSPSKYKVVGLNTVYAVLDPNFFRPYTGTPYVVPGTIGVASVLIPAANYDFGGEGVAWHDNTTKDGDGAWRTPDYVDVVADYSPRSTVGWTGNGEWLTWSVTVQATGNYNIDSYLGSNGTNGRYTLFIDNILVTPTQLAVSNTANGAGNNNNQLPFPSGPIAITQGYHIIKFFENTVNYDFRGLVFTRLN